MLSILCKRGDSLQVVGKLRLYNNDILVSLWVGPDGKNSDQYIVQVINLLKKWSNQF